MSERCVRNRGSWSPGFAVLLDETCDRFEAAWRGGAFGKQPAIRSIQFAQAFHDLT
jgi:hypothetical protein